VAGLLWSVAPRLLYFLVAYAAVGTWLTTSIFGRRLMLLSFQVLRSEGDLRFDLVRVRENAGALLARVRVRVGGRVYGQGQRQGWGKGFSKPGSGIGIVPGQD